MTAHNPLAPRAIEADIAGLVEPEDAGLGADDVWARAVWSLLIEPGDGAAGAAVRHLGAREALQRVASARSDATGTPDLAEGISRWRPRLVDASLSQIFDGARRAGLRLLTPESQHWPHALDDLGDHAPLCLWVRGEAATLVRNRPAIALVGARAATSYGDHVAMELASGLAARGVSVVSGAAYGIDGAAHRATLAAGGETIAVLAGGADRPYPAGHADLIDRIAARGAVIAEVPPTVAPTKWRFLQRNRLISALADATVVVEAGWRSGSLNTAAHAATLGRPLGAVPGPVTSAASAGCHRLLREFDARCVTNVDEIMELVPGGLPATSGRGEHPRRSADQIRVLDALSTRARRGVDDIARRSGMNREDTVATLGMLELEGLVERDTRGWRRAGSSPTLF